MDTQKGAVVYYVDIVSVSGQGYLLLQRRDGIDTTTLAIKPTLEVIECGRSRYTHPLELPGIDLIRYTINKTIVLRLKGRGRPVYLHNGVWSFIRPEKFR